ncbi:MAG TPA: J domain-containing protein [Acidimicrobiia bacterium]|nr:J domain-containing protein [Acidimicrobiia bacterium]
MLLAELNIRHSRRHQPTRRVALGDTYLPTSGAAFGAVLLGAVVAEHLDDLDEDQRELLPRLLHDARDGLGVPRIALRYRLQTDTHGLDRSRHRIISESPGSNDRPAALILEFDEHAAGAPQLIGAVMAAAALPSSARQVALRAIESSVMRPVLPEGLTVRRLAEGVPGLQPFAPLRGAEEPDTDALWRGVPAERRWAMEVLGMRAGMPLGRTDVQARFRRLVRLAHPDQGGARDGAAERLAELREARELLLSLVRTRPDSAEAQRTG